MYMQYIYIHAHRSLSTEAVAAMTQTAPPDCMQTVAKWRSSAGFSRSATAATAATVTAATAASVTAATPVSTRAPAGTLE
jgi:hypothetical protein